MEPEDDGEDREGIVQGRNPGRLKTVGACSRNSDTPCGSTTRKSESGNRNPPKPKERDKQFNYIGAMRESFARRSAPIISVDAKKKEHIGNFKNGGRRGRRKHPSFTTTIFPPTQWAEWPLWHLRYPSQPGLYLRGDLSGNAGLCGRFHRAVVEGGRTRPLSVRRQTLDLADCGGGNSARSRVWKYRLQKQLLRCPSPERHRLPLSAGSVQREPHRTSSLLRNQQELGREAASQLPDRSPLHPNVEDLLRIASPRLVRKKYETGERVLQDDMNALTLSRPKTLPDGTTP